MIGRPASVMTAKRTNPTSEMPRSIIDVPIMLNGIAALGNGSRVTIWIDPTTLGTPAVTLWEKNVQGTSAARVNSVYGTPGLPDSTPMTPWNTTVATNRLASGGMMAHEKPTSDCRYRN